MIIAMKLKYLGKSPRSFPVPVPFVSMSEKTGEVLCDPIGEFTYKDAQYLLNLGTDQFELIEEIDDGKPEAEPGIPEEMPLCACNCGKRLTWKRQYKYLDVLPKYIAGHHMAKQPSAA